MKTDTLPNSTVKLVSTTGLFIIEEETRDGGVRQIRLTSNQAWALRNLLTQGLFRQLPASPFPPSSSVEL